MISIGKVLKTHGYRGKMRISFDPVYAHDMEKLTAIVIDTKKMGQLPFFIVEKELISTSEALISLEDIDSMESAKPLCGQPIYAMEEDIAIAIDSNPLLALTGYLAVEANGNNLGKITDILELPGQTLAEIDIHGTMTLVPLNDTFIKKIDRKKKILHLELPAGLLELND